MKKRGVIVLKAESDSTDNYAQMLRENNFNAIFVPTLDFGFKQLEELKSKLMIPDKYAGIILTSPRCIDAVREALGSNVPMPSGWKLLHNYSVGEVTHNLAMNSLDQLFTQGKTTGNATNLADFIIESHDGTKSLPFLLPCGNLRTDTLFNKLIANGYLIDACEVYETICHPDLNKNLSIALQEDIEFLAFFSPSGVNCVYEYFIKNNINFDDKKLVAIGPSTRRALESKGLTVFRTAEKPSVEYLIKVLINPDDCRRPQLNEDD